MRATGIVRRVDDLGRVVIPKEIRRTLNIREGAPLELFVEGDKLCFRKYVPSQLDYLVSCLSTVEELLQEEDSESLKIELRNVQIALRELKQAL